MFAFFAYAVPRATAEDLTSLTFERVVRNWRRYDADRAGERTWIMAIARNALTDHYRRQRHRDALSTDEHPGLLDSFHSSHSTDERLQRDELLGWLASLPQREQEILALRYGADLSAADIARLTGLSVSNVHQILSRSLRKLRAIAAPPA